MYKYKNLTNCLQVVNTNAGRTLYLGPKEEKELFPGEETSLEIVERTSRTSKTGFLNEVLDDVHEHVVVPQIVWQRIEAESKTALVTTTTKIHEAEDVDTVQQSEMLPGLEEKTDQPTKKPTKSKRRKKNKLKGE